MDIDKIEKIVERITSEFDVKGQLIWCISLEEIMAVALDRGRTETYFYLNSIEERVLRNIRDNGYDVEYSFDGKLVLAQDSEYEMDFQTKVAEGLIK